MPHRKKDVKDLVDKLNYLRHEHEVLEKLKRDVQMEIARFEVEKMHLMRQPETKPDLAAGAIKSEETEKTVADFLKEIDNTKAINKKSLVLGQSAANEESEEEGNEPDFT